MNLEERFGEDLRDSSRVAAPSEYPFPGEFRAIPDAKVAVLSKIAVTLDNTTEYMSARRDATGIRSSYCTTLHKMRSESLVSSLKASFDERPDEKWDGRDDKITAVRPYEKGSHPFVFHMHFYLKILELERELLSSVLAATGCSREEQDALFMRIAAESMDMFFRKAQEVIQQKLGPNKVLVLLDVLENWKECLPGFHEVLSRINENVLASAQDDHNILHRITAMENDFQQAARSEMTARREAVQQHPHKDVRPDGGYHALTLSTTKFLRQLLAFAPTIEALYQKDRTSPGAIGRLGGSGSLGRIETSVTPSALTGATPTGEISGPVALKPDPTRPQNAMTEVVSKFLEALQSNIQAKSHQYKVPSLVHIFLLNNYHYISKSVRSSELLEFAGSGFVAGYQREIVKARTAYQRESWTKALMALRSEELKTLSTTFTNSQRKIIKSKFVAFNDEFERCYNSQKQFSVPDSDLRSQLRNENVELVVTAYQAFMKQIGDREFASNRGKYVKFRFDGLEQMLNRFFDEDA